MSHHHWHGGEAFVRNIDQFVSDEGVDLVAFKKGQRKDDVTQKYVRNFTQREGVLYVGKAQIYASILLHCWEKSPAN